MSISTWLNPIDLLRLSYYGRILCVSPSDPKALVMGDAKLKKKCQDEVQSYLSNKKTDTKIRVRVSQEDLEILKTWNTAIIQRGGSDSTGSTDGTDGTGSTILVIPNMDPHPDQKALSTLGVKLDKFKGKYVRKDPFGGDSRLKTALTWLINTAKVATGIASIIVSMGEGGDEVIKIISAVYSTASFMVDFVELYEDAKNDNLYLKEIMSINFLSGPIGVEKEVKTIMMQMIANGHEDLIQDLCQVLVKMLDAIAGVFGDWISSFIPDDAGIVGIAIQEILTALASDVASEILDKYHLLPESVRQVLQSPPRMEQFLRDLLKTIKDLLTKNNDDWSIVGLESRYAKAAIHMIPIIGDFFASYAGQDLTKDIFDLLQNKFNPFIPDAVKGIEIVLPMVFAILSIYKYCSGGIDQLKQEAMQLQSQNRLFPAGYNAVNTVNTVNTNNIPGSVIIRGQPPSYSLKPLPPMNYDYQDYQRFLASMK